MDVICERIALWERGENPYVIHEFENSIFVIGDHQFYPGYSLLLLKQHVRELHELDEESYLILMRDLRIAGAAICKTFSPWKMNYQCLGNQDQHVHWHILPRYADDPYHRTLPFTDYVKGEVDLSNHIIAAEQARELAERVRENL